MARLHTQRFDPGLAGPLAGLRVVDMSRLVAGNMLTLQLADFGAQVVKIEPPAGDTLRNFRADGYDTWWKTYARNKHSVALDLRQPGAVEVVKAMAAQADALIESFRPGVLEAMGLAPDVLLAINPKLVITRLSGWGQTGPYRERPGFGTLVEGYSGFASMNGFADREPVLPPMFLGDMTAGLYGASATMMALWEVRANGGRGQVVDLSLFEPMLSILGPQSANFRFTGEVKQRTGSRSSTTAPRNAYLTADGQWVCLSTSTETMAARLFHAIGRPDITQDPRTSTARGRLQHVEEIDGIVGGFIRGRTLAENLAFFEQAQVTIGPMCDASQLLDDPYVIERRSLVDVEDEELGFVPMHNVTPRMSTTPGGFRRPAPAIGEHNRELLLPLLGAAEYDRLLTAGAIVEARRPPAPAHPLETKTTP
ncbi:CoA transferase [Aquincola sp. MAHUQ-54]|uniref:CoA transferase n=1 Tax=Aquincola agrisoli TaxID=3119538 RepID=A0AAW9Q7D9_9BURK